MESSVGDTIDPSLFDLSLSFSSVDLDKINGDSYRLVCGISTANDSPCFLVYVMGLIGFGVS